MGQKNPKFSPADGRLLDLKDNIDHGVEAAVNDFVRGLVAVKLPTSTIVAIMPGHNAAPSNEGRALARVATTLAERNKTLVAKIDTLIRTRTVPKKAGGGDRDLAEELKSLKIAKVVKGETVLILDDTVTTGTSLTAARRLLANAGAKRVAAVAIGRTVQYF